MALVLLLIAGMLAFALSATLLMLLWQGGARLVKYLKTQWMLRRQTAGPRS